MATVEEIEQFLADLRDGIETISSACESMGCEVPTMEIGLNVTIQL
jgi:hypothetical protein